MARKRSATAGSVVQTEQRRKEITRMRIAGYTLQQIADHLGITKQSVHEHVKAVISSDHEATKELAAEYREIELQRLEALHQAYSGTAAGGDDKAASVVLKAADQRAKLLGLYVTKTEVTGANGGAIKTEASVGPDLSKLTDDQLAQLNLILSAATPPSDTDAS